MSSMQMLSLKDLQAKGIRFSKQHIHRLTRAGKFPKPVKLGQATNAWIEDEIDAWLQERAAARTPVPER